MPGRNGPQGFKQYLMDFLYRLRGDLKEDNSLVAAQGIESKIGEVTVAGNQDGFSRIGKSNNFSIGSFIFTKFSKGGTAKSFILQDVFGFFPGTVIKQERHEGLVLGRLFEFFKEMNFLLIKKLIRKRDTRPDILGVKVGVELFRANLVRRISGGKQFKHHRNPYARSSDSWFTMKDIGVNRDFFQQIIHIFNLLLSMSNIPSLWSFVKGHGPRVRGDESPNQVNKGAAPFKEDRTASSPVVVSLDGGAQLRTSLNGLSWPSPDFISLNDEESSFKLRFTKLFKE